MMDVVPGEHFPGRENVPVVHELLAAVLHVLVDIVADQHVQLLPEGDERAQLVQRLREGLFVQPIVGVHDLVVKAAGMAQTLIDPFPVAAVFLVDGAHDVGILGGVAVADGGGVVLGGAVVHQNDLDIVAALQNALDALVHIARGVIAGHGEGDEFFLACFVHDHTILSHSSSARAIMASIL